MPCKRNRENCKLSFGDKFKRLNKLLEQSCETDSAAKIYMDSDLKVINTICPNTLIKNADCDYVHFPDSCFWRKIEEFHCQEPVYPDQPECRRKKPLRCADCYVRIPRPCARRPKRCNDEQ